MKAMRILRTRLFQRYESEQHKERNELRRSQQGTGDRSDRIRTYNFPQNRVTDHRIGLTLYSLNKIVDGEIDEIIEALRLAENMAKLKEIDEIGK